MMTEFSFLDELSFICPYMLREPGLMFCCYLGNCQNMMNVDHHALQKAAGSFLKFKKL